VPNLIQVCRDCGRTYLADGEVEILSLVKDVKSELKMVEHMWFAHRAVNLWRGE